MKSVLPSGLAAATLLLALAGPAAPRPAPPPPGVHGGGNDGCVFVYDTRNLAVSCVTQCASSSCPSPVIIEGPNNGDPSTISCTASCPDRNSCAGSLTLGSSWAEPSCSNLDCPTCVMSTVGELSSCGC